MNNQRIADLISLPHTAKPGEREEIHALVEQYPYSGFLRVLDAKLSHLADSPNKGQRLTSAAIYITDRTVLKKYMVNEKELFSTKTRILIAAAEPEAETKASLEKIQPLEEKVAEKLVDKELKPAIEISDKKVKSEKSEIPLAAQKLTKSELDDLSEELLRNIEEYKQHKIALDALLDKKLAESKKSRVTKTQSSSKKKTIKGQAKTQKASAVKNTDSKTTSHPTKKTGKKITKDDGKKKSEPAKKTGKVISKAKAKTEVEIDSAPKSSEQETDKPKSKPVKKLKKEQQVEIIENFIKTEPLISKVKSGRGSVSKEDLSVSSSQFNDSIITENLAGIMVKQGKIDKAIDIYKRLIWKFPQKKAYFATQIEELKKK